MATALETDPINELEENLQCTVCLEPLKDPRTLPCFHSFCKDCLEDVVKTRRDEAPHGRLVREFPCPNCREMFTLDPDKNVADMRRNHFICNIVRVTAVLNRDRGTGVPCSHNCSQSYSVARCVTCENFLCQECLAIHDSYRGHTGHSVLTMEELSKPENRKKINDKMYCNEHQGKKLKVYCETCDQLICKDCMDFKHTKPDHSCFLVKDVADKYKELLASNNKKMDEVLTEGNAILERLTSSTERLGHDAEHVKREITKKKELIAMAFGEMLDQKADSLKNDVDRRIYFERLKLNIQKRETKPYVDNIQRSVLLSKKLVDQGTEEEILSSQKSMLKSADNLLKKRREYLKEPESVKLCYTPTPCADKEPLNQEILSGLEKSLGKVIEGKDSKGIVGHQSKLNPKAPVFALSRSFSSPAPSYSNAMTRNSSEGNLSGSPKKRDNERCPMCQSDFTDKKTLSECGHSFCAACIDKVFEYQNKCPVCGQVDGARPGNQPPGVMSDKTRSTQLPGFTECGTLVITYHFPSGIQELDHPNPGKPYEEAMHIAYLPDNKEGRKVLILLKRAFEQKLTFTIGRSETTGLNDCVVCKIEHKKSVSGGPSNFGYPDPNYLARVEQELAEKGITEY
ncbi:tripartite motif-containing protein 45-like [Dendronephthya gigantea]|uniref:tripartite motif-containing protein 45-like n=1 Tax=Dendronephthya gigantea TaxID=151771 RepID=UPI00106B3966|nr:tripartite motif-containing protein 45-like [Dendronephthya gigantea]